MEEKKFRCAAKTFFLTYPRCDSTKEVLLTHLRTKGVIVQYVIGKEEHKEDDAVLGKYHLHAVIRYQCKINVKDPKFFDLMGFHCNIQAARNFQAAAQYAKKDGDYIENVEFDHSNPVNYRKRKDDFEAWEGDRLAKSREEIAWPLILPDGSEHRPVGKRRHVWIVGPPDGGKSQWAKSQLKGKIFFARSPCKYPFERYNKEQVILYDDIKPSQEEWLAVSDDHWSPMHVFGECRFRSNLWPMDVPLVMIVLSNDLPAFNNMEAFNARFIIVHMNQIQ